MNIGLAYTLRSAAPDTSDSDRDDEEEELDSPETIESLRRTLEGLGHEVELLEDGERLIRRLLDGPRPDLVFNIAEGRGIARSREAWTPAILESLGVPHTGSDPLTLAATLDKQCAKRLVRDAGGRTPAWVLVGDDLRAVDQALLALEPPIILKPAFEGSSKGIFEENLVFAHEDLPAAVERLKAGYRQPILAEEYIEGEELTVGVVGNDPPTILGVMRVIPTTAGGGPFVYSLAVKRDYERRVRYECPAQLSPGALAAVEAATRLAWQALGCRDVARFDFRLRGDAPYFLECNPLPGINPLCSDLVILCRLVGIDYDELIGRIVDAAARRLGMAARHALA